MMSLSGCATLVQGTHQEIEISSTPVGAEVRVDGTMAGTTPLTVKLERQSEHTISIRIAGYDEAILKLSGTMSGWVWGNLAYFIVFAPVGLAVDFISGGFYTYSIDQLYVDLEKEPPGSMDHIDQRRRLEKTIGEKKP